MISNQTGKIQALNTRAQRQQLLRLISELGYINGTQIICTFHLTAKVHIHTPRPSFKDMTQ